MNKNGEDIIDEMKSKDPPVNIRIVITAIMTKPWGGGALMAACSWSPLHLSWYLFTRQD